MLVLSHCVSGYEHASSVVRAVRTYWADKEGRKLDEDSALLPPPGLPHQTGRVKTT